MTPDPFKPIDIFHKTRKFDDVYAWKKVEILHFLVEVAAKPADYGVTDAHVMEHLKALQGYIAGLANWEDPTKKSPYWKPFPEQQTLRTDGSHVKPSEEMTWTVNDKKERLYLIFDLLGVFLSLITSVSASSATAKNYFFPLVVLYSKWCCELGASMKNRPTITQVTWSKKGTELYPFFGASVAGFNKQSGDSAKRTRWSYLKASGIIPSNYPDYDDSPNRDKENGGSIAGTRYGNCGETYPFLYILKDNALVADSFGIAVELAALFENPVHYDKYKGAELWKFKPGPMWPPCNNCKLLLKERGVHADAHGNYPQYQLYTT